MELTKITTLDGTVIAGLTTESTRSSYNQPVWEGPDALDIGDEIRITDIWSSDDYPHWDAKVVAIDPIDGWALVETEGCDDKFYAINPAHGFFAHVINKLAVPPDLPCRDEAAWFEAGLATGDCYLDPAVRFPGSNGWGSRLF